MKALTRKEIDTLMQRYPELRVCEGSIIAAVNAIIGCYSSGGKLMACGNGGSAADSYHVVGELMKGFVLRRKLPQDMCDRLRKVAPMSANYLIDNLQGALPAISLVSEVGLSTAYANDQAPDLAFAQQVLGQGRAGDVLLGISTSGNSANVIYAAQVAKAQGICVVGLTGRKFSRLSEQSDICIQVPSDITYQIQEYHLPVYHTLCLALEMEFFGEE